MQIIIEINETEKEIKTAIAKGWNMRFGGSLTGNNIKTISDKEDIVAAIAYISLGNIEIGRVR